MRVKYIQEEDITNYKKCAMFIGLPHCTFKCEKECGKPICQNSALAKALTIEIDNATIIKKYKQNFFTNAVVFGGLEPFDSFDELLEFIQEFRQQCEDDIVIYTGYTEDEIIDKIKILKDYKNIIIKYGRFIPDQESHYDAVLGVGLASPNQYAKKIS